MSKPQRFVFLSAEFYAAFPYSQYPEIEQKPSRPYVQVLTLIDGIQYAIPLRSHINHPHVLWTDKKNHCGLDFSKAVVISDPKYIDNVNKPYIRPLEFNALRGKDYRIRIGMEKYIREYLAAKNNSEDKINRQLVEKSTLQYFESYFIS